MRIPSDNMTIGEARRHGRMGDTQLVHLNKAEVDALKSLTPDRRLTINPVTGEQEAFLPFLLSMLPSLFPAIGTTLAGATGIGALANPLTLGALGSGLGTWAETGDIKKGLLAGLGGYALGGLMGGAGSLFGKGAAGAAGTGATHAAGQAAGQVAQNTAGQAAASGPAFSSGMNLSGFSSPFTTANLAPMAAQSAPGLGLMQQVGLGMGSMLGAGIGETEYGGEKKKKKGPYDQEQLPVPRSIQTPPPGYQHGLMPEWNWFAPQDTITQIMDGGPGYAVGGLVGGQDGMTSGGMYAPSEPKPYPVSQQPTMQPAIQPSTQPSPRPAVMQPTAQPTDGRPPMGYGGGMAAPFMSPGGWRDDMRQPMVPPQFFQHTPGFRANGWEGMDRMMDRRRGYGGMMQPGFMQSMQMEGPQERPIPGYANGGTVSVGKPFDPAAFDWTRAVIAPPPATPSAGVGVVPYTPSQSPAVNPSTANTGGGVGLPAPTPSPGAPPVVAQPVHPNMNHGMPTYQNPMNDPYAMLDQILGRQGVKAFADGGRVPKTRFERERRKARPSQNVEDRRGLAARLADRAAIDQAQSYDMYDFLFNRRDPRELGDVYDQLTAPERAPPLMGPPLPGEQRPQWRRDIYDQEDIAGPHARRYTFAHGGYVEGPGDGSSDSVPATINGRGPAKLSDGEVVIPADAVAHIGNGSNRAGAKRLMNMVKSVRKKKTGKTGLPPRV